MSLNTILATTPLTSTNYVLKATGTTIGNSLIFDNGTNVGIGNTNTSYTLDVSGTGRFTGSVGIGGAPTVFSTNIYFDVIGTTTTQGGIIQTKTSNGSVVGSFFADSNGLNIRTETSSPMLFTLGGSEKMRILTSNNVGIGITSPTAIGTGYTTVGINGVNGAGLTFNINGASANSYIYTASDGFNFINVSGSYLFYNGGTERMRLTNGGQLGIGTTSIDSTISVDIQNLSPTSNNVFLRLKNNNGSEDCGIKIAGTFGTAYEHTFGVNTIIASGDLIFHNANTLGYRWYVDGNVKMSISGAGNIGMNRVGNTSSLLSLRGINQNSSTYCILVDNAITDLFQVRNDGLIFFGTAASAPYNYNVTFSPRTAGLGAGGDFGYITSTRESKGNIETIKNIDFINQLNPVSFNYRKKNENKTEFIDELYEDVYYGFIADEVEALDKNLVFYDDVEGGGKKLSGVHYNSMIAILTKAVQELSKQNEELSNRLIKLESK